MTVALESPGKLVLMGEYAVLFGSPSAVMAVDRRARVTLEPNQGDTWSIVSPGFSDESIQLKIDPEGARSWSDTNLARTTFLLVEKVFANVFGAGIVKPQNLRPAHLTLDTRQFFDTNDPIPVKLGLGSSAALTTALVNALFVWAGSELPAPSVRWLERLVQIHRSVQGGRGSGIDVAASLFGGVVAFRLSDAGEVAGARALELPSDLRIRCIWTGKSASTGDFLTRLEASRELDSRAVDAAIDDLARISGRGVDALENARTGEFVSAVDEYCGALEVLGNTIEMPILSSEHRRLVELARTSGVHYKPSGAGGGDFGLAFAAGDEPIEDFVVCVEQEGFKVMEIAIDPLGTDAAPRLSAVPGSLI